MTLHEIVRSFDGTPDSAYVDSRILMMTVGQLRQMFAMAQAQAAMHRDDHVDGLAGMLGTVRYATEP